ncbi:hypothetical protein GALMADRAFT_227641 [Galerina marginata CBS 339.88]|uniref:Uncharacterized protein n=1 Tax=Galerina marginata (strain CBS 339.88) TaxID=685588 RepID=A0A067T4H5_GALM3|nr:hypothetical protein GALMADRAFT_227641 [Galerina marginata CBS 339.88]
MALNILALINLFFVTVFPLALHQMYKQSKTRPAARSNRNKKNYNKRNIKNNKKVAEGDNEVDLSELARHLDGIDEV